MDKERLFIAILKGPEHVVDFFHEVAGKNASSKRFSRALSAFKEAGQLDVVLGKSFVTIKVSGIIVYHGKLKKEMFIALYMTYGGDEDDT